MPPEITLFLTADNRAWSGTLAQHHAGRLLAASDQRRDCDQLIDNPVPVTFAADATLADPLAQMRAHPYLVYTVQD